MEFFGNFFWLKTRVMGTFTQKISLLIFFSTKIFRLIQVTVTSQTITTTSTICTTTSTSFSSASTIHSTSTTNSISGPIASVLNPISSAPTGLPDSGSGSIMGALAHPPRPTRLTAGSPSITASPRHVRSSALFGQWPGQRSNSPRTPKGQTIDRQPVGAISPNIASYFIKPP